jgi:hypothetical protein
MSIVRWAAGNLKAEGQRAAAATGSIILQASTGAEGGAAIAGTSAAIERPSKNSAERKIIVFPFEGILAHADGG